MRTRSLGIFSGTLALLLGIAPATLAQGTETYVKYQGGAEDGALQCAVATFTHPTSKQQIVLYGVVHIAEAEYYARVQQDLDSYTTVLFEGVAPGKEQPTEADQSLGEMQKAMGEMLGLSFQKDGIDYTRKNLVHADMTMDQLKAALGGGSINPMGGLMDENQLKNLGPLMKMAAGFAKAMMANNPKMRDQLKGQMAKQMSGADMSQALGEKMNKAILYDRNDVCLDVLWRQLEAQKDGSIAIFYGAAHMPDLEEKLGKKGWTRSDKRWMSAWKIGQGVNDGWTAPAGAGKVPAPAPQPAPAKADGYTPPNDGRRWF